MNIPEPLVRLLSAVEKDAEAAVFHLLEKVLTSPSPKDAAARAAQVLAHEVAADAAVEALFEAKREAKKHVPGSGV
jgi:hypothetical protein